MNNNIFWPHPKSRDVGSFGGIDIYAEALKYVKKENTLSIYLLTSEEEGIFHRFKGSLISTKLTKTSARDVIKELESYNWIRKVPNDNGKYIITKEGLRIAELLEYDQRSFRRELAIKMYERFVIPGWFVYRLFELNPDRQGEIVLPSPRKDKFLPKRKWEKTEWTSDLEIVAIESAEIARKRLPGSFPVSNALWGNEVKKVWYQLGEVKKKRVAKSKTYYEKKEEKPTVETYSTRRRLSLAMREASINLLFNNSPPNKERNDFTLNKHPVPPRSFQSWCPILSAVEFIFYTDHHPDISGRLIFPCGVFRNNKTNNYDVIERIKDPYENKTLMLYQPDWYTIKNSFIDTFSLVYSKISKNVGSLYVSLLDVRDEVCRILRISSVLFDEYMEKLYRENIRESVTKFGTFSISLESDIRPDRFKGSGLLRRPVYVDKIPYTLIAMSFDKYNINN